MTITSKKITKVNTTVLLRKSLKNEFGVAFASMSATIDERHPLGTVTFTALDQPIYEANIEDARIAYEIFQKEVIETAKNTVPASEEVEEV